eukprot:5721695-Heterocapsa_arctica.AAC.1
MAYQQAMAEVIQGQGSGQRAAEPTRGLGFPAGPPGKAAPVIPQGTPPGSAGQRASTPKPEGAA